MCVKKQKQTGVSAVFYLKSSILAQVIDIKMNLNQIKTMKKYICTVCQWVYDPEVGDPESGIEPGTAFEDIPEDWVCPVCGVGKDDFEPYEE